MKYIVCLVAFCTAMMAGCKGSNPKSAKDVMLQIGSTTCKVLDHVCTYKDLVCGRIKAKAEEKKATTPTTP